MNPLRSPIQIGTMLWLGPVLVIAFAIVVGALVGLVNALAILDAAVATR